MGKKKKKSIRGRKLVRILISLLVLMVVLLGVVVAWRYDFLGIIDSSIEDPIEILIEGECHIVMENVFYTIKTDDDCKKECRNDCWVRKLDYSNHEFREVENTCNFCDCFCE